ncbi:MAG: hypothetical protein COW01_00565 [Bdellovibrionales bacterium CG12_big_fil_rev_8_21_14_0_65_38_15]|nr:MAG: hypothetical protein COW79_10100 [Bdellovibrionales bacterium CG22_combo_CG10-13_8_21_14_all_38_13]PIQ57459.1 MAG: hypothetical protein COW01_00565 [Bdellovibrionales bacterium CG12_big_fil_rev_8_21_14_0_65_38_15]PIR31180.1 MAG: hypothetical protein COV38_02045 [Bdellovibrionales bacterium CG11_big_fil_rev_8_21_14_0_20_38_13]
MPYLFGQLQDEKTAALICKRLGDRGITAQYTRANDGSIGLFVDKEEEFVLAHDIYRVSVGMPPKFEIPKETIEMAKIPFGLLTKGIILVCVSISILMWIGDASVIRSTLLISKYTQGLDEILNEGQWWRLFTPALVHFGIMHILFNMLWFKSLGSMIEFTRGKYFFAGLILVSAVFSNLFQWWFKGPSFGGMSGVVYSLLGFIWMVKTFNPKEEFSLPKQDVYMMIGWFVLCLTGLLGPIANFAHAGGLFVGMVAGIFCGIQSSEEYRIVDVLKYVSASIVVIIGTIFVELTFNL